MKKVKKRRRGTAIVETENGILVTAGKSKVFSLPGGGAENKETRVEATIRELREETTLKAYHVKFLFRHKGYIHKSHGQGYFRDYHTVCLIKAKGIPKPQKEIEYIANYKPGSNIRISKTARDIIQRYYRYKRSNKLKQKQTNIFHRIMDWLT